jgi:hypothetical protein
MSFSGLKNFGLRTRRGVQDKFRTGGQARGRGLRIFERSLGKQFGVRGIRLRLEIVLERCRFFGRAAIDRRDHIVIQLGDCLI